MKPSGCPLRVHRSAVWANPRAVLPLSEGGVGGTRFGVIYDVAKEAEMIDDSVACTIEQIQKSKCADDPSYGFCATPTPEAVP